MKKENEELERLLEQYRYIFNLPNAKLVLDDLQNFVKRTAINRLDPNPNACVFRLGQESVIEYILSRIKR